MIKAISCKSPGEMELVQVEKPELTPGNLMIKIMRVGICGTDYHAYEGTQPFFNYPRILGHEIGAEVVAVNPGSTFQIGDRVTLRPYLSCGVCIACKSGRSNCCEKMSVIGVHQDGAMQEFLCVPEDIILRNNALSFDELALIEPLAISAHGIAQSELKAGEDVLVIGAGPIGLGTAKLAMIAGANVIIADFNHNRLSFASQQLQIPHLIHLQNESMEEGIHKATKGGLPTVIFDCTGNQKAINGALNHLAHSGRLILIGLQRDKLIFDHPEFHKRETTLKSSRNALLEDFEYVISKIIEGQLKPLEFVSHQVGFEDVPAAFPGLLAAQDQVVKALINFQ